MTPEMAMARFYAKAQAAGELAGRIVKIVPDSRLAMEIYREMNRYLAELEVEEVEPLGNNILPAHKERGRVIPMSLAAREIARDL